MHSAIGRTWRPKGQKLSGDVVMREAFIAPRFDTPRGLRNYLDTIHSTGVATTADFRLRQRAGLRLQERIARTH